MKHNHNVNKTILMNAVQTFEGGIALLLRDGIHKIQHNV